MESLYSNQFVTCLRVTNSQTGHILSNVNVWSPCGQWLYYDIRSDRHGTSFDGRRIERVCTKSGLVETVFESSANSSCGVVLTHPQKDKIVFIEGPHFPNPQWNYGPSRRHGLIVEVGSPHRASILDARDLVPPFTVGALRGGSHVHQFSPAGDWLSFTYEDEYLHSCSRTTIVSARSQANQRNVGIAIPNRPTSVLPRHPRNESGTHFCTIVSQTTDSPIPGSDQIQRAYEEAWIGDRGFRKTDGTWQNRALAMLGDVILADGSKTTELFRLDLPENLQHSAEDHWKTVSSWESMRLSPPPSVNQIRLTYHLDTPSPGLQGPRFWPRSTPDGKYIFVLKNDSQGVTQFWRVETANGNSKQWTQNRHPINSAFTISSDGKWLAHGMDKGICVTSCSSGRTIRLSEPFPQGSSPNPEAVVWNPGGDSIAFVCPTTDSPMLCNQIFILKLDRDKIDREL